MPPKKEPKKKPSQLSTAEFENAGLIVEQAITDTLETNFMPYAISVIISRAIPEIDGFKPSHRKLLYTMYKMNLLNGPRTKSANVVGQTMRLNPHGDQAIYETMVRMTRGNEALLHPYVDSKGNFGKAYSRDMAYAASRYTEVKLDAIAGELFRDIDKDTVDFVDNYDGTMKEPTLFPTTFPSILVNSTMGIAVGMASSICPFNLQEICEATIGLLKDENFDVTTVLQAPDFPGGGYILPDPEEFQKIVDTGRGNVKVRSRYQYDRSNNCIEITQIPPSTTVEAIMDKIVDLVKAGKIREISDMRDETDLSGLKLTLDLKRGVEPDKLMAKLFRITPLQDIFSCNFNLLIGGYPQTLGIKPILLEWIAFRSQCIRRRIYYEKQQKEQKLHLLEGLSRILLDIDRAIKIIRETRSEAEVVTNLMEGFSIDELQAEYVAEIKLRHLNREYILKRINEIQQLKQEIQDMQQILENPKKLRTLIVTELREVARKYGTPRKSLILLDLPEEEEEEQEELSDYPVLLFVTKEGYFKKITPQSYRMSNEHKLKEGDQISQSIESANSAELLVFTNHSQVYKTRASEFEETKASLLGDYLPAKLSMDEGETVVYVAVLKEYKGFMLFLFENGKVAKVDAGSYETKTRRKKLLGAYCAKFPLVQALYCREDHDLILQTANNRMTVVNTNLLEAKSTKDSQGVSVLAVKKNDRASGMRLAQPEEEGLQRYRAKTLPTAGVIIREAQEQQLTF